MRRRMLLLFGTVLVLLAVAVLVAWSQRARAPAPPTDLPGDNAAAGPYKEELNCIDRVLRNPNLKSADVRPALNACRAARSNGNRSSDR